MHPYNFIKKIKETKIQVSTIYDVMDGGGDPGGDPKENLYFEFSEEMLHLIIKLNKILH